MIQTNIKILCPLCQHRQGYEVPLLIDGQEEPRLKRRLMLDDDLLQTHCQACGAKLITNQSFLYLDSQAKYALLWPSHGIFDAEDEEADLSFVADDVPADLVNYQLRIVQDLADLREKIVLFDQGACDQEVEMVKILSKGALLRQVTDIDTYDCRYTADGKNVRLSYRNDDHAFTTDLSADLLALVRRKYKKALQKDYSGQWIQVDPRWAGNLLNHLDGKAQAGKQK